MSYKNYSLVAQDENCGEMFYKERWLKSDDHALKWANQNKLDMPFVHCWILIRNEDDGDWEPLDFC